MTVLKLLNFVLVFFPGSKLYHAHHDIIGAAVFVALFVALIYVDVQGLPFYATLITKLVICAALYSAVLTGLHFYPAISWGISISVASSFETRARARSSG